jgi:hypothetical protein
VAARAGVALHIAPTEHSSLFRLGGVDVDALARYLKANPDEYITGIDIAMSFDEAMAFYDDTGILFLNHGCGRRMTLIQDAIARGEYAKEWNGVRGMDAFQIHAMRGNSTMIVNTGFFGLDEPEAQALSDLLRRGRKQAHYVADFLRKTLPGLERSFVIATPNATGLRRTRYLKTYFTLTRELYDTAPSYDDRIGRGVVVGKGQLRITNETFDIPLRCILPPRIDGLLIGSGRSASCMPAELLRTMPVTMTVGQGAGVTASVAVNQGVQPRKTNLAAVQAELGRQGANIA